MVCPVDGVACYRQGNMWVCPFGHTFSAGSGFTFEVRLGLWLPA